MLNICDAYASECSRDDEMIEYNNQLHNGIVEAHSWIFQGFKNSQKAELLMPYARQILRFLGSIYQEKYMDEQVTKAAVGFLGDLANTLGSNFAPLLRQCAF